MIERETRAGDPCQLCGSEPLKTSPNGLACMRCEPSQFPVWDTVAFGAMFFAGSYTTRGHVLYRGPDGEKARALQVAFAKRLSRWKRSYSVYLLKDGRISGSVAR